METPHRGLRIGRSPSAGDEPFCHAFVPSPGGGYKAVVGGRRLLAERSAINGQLWFRSTSGDCFLQLRSGSEGALIDQSLTVNPFKHIAEKPSLKRSSKNRSHPADW